MPIQNNRQHKKFKKAALSFLERRFHPKKTVFKTIPALQIEWFISLDIVFVALYEYKVFV